MKKDYNTLYDSKYYKRMSKKIKSEHKAVFDEHFQAANILHMAAQKCVGDHGQTSIMHISEHENNLLVKKILKKYPQVKPIILEINEESRAVNKDKYNRMIEDKVANTVFVIDCIEKESKYEPEEM